MNSKQLNILLGLVVIVLLVVVGYLTLANKTPNQTLNQNNALQKGGNVVSTQTKISPTLTPKPTQQANKQPVNAIEPTLAVKKDEISQTSTGYAYKNNEFGFSLSFPGVWEGLTTRKSVNSATKGAWVYFQVPLNTCKLTPNASTGACYASPLAIDVYPLALWNQIKNQPNPETYLGQNSQYAFTYTTWQEPDAGMENFNFEFSKVIASFKLVK